MQYLSAFRKTIEDAIEEHDAKVEQSSQMGHLLELRSRRPGKLGQSFRLLVP